MSRPVFRHPVPAPCNSLKEAWAILVTSFPYSMRVPIIRRVVSQECFNPAPMLPHELRIIDFELATQDVYDFFYDVNTNLGNKGLRRLAGVRRPAGASGTISDMLTSSLAKHSRTLRENRYHSGHPDLVGHGVTPTMRSARGPGRDGRLARSRIGAPGRLMSGSR